MGGREEDSTLDDHRPTHPFQDPLVEWTGLFIFIVGAYGTMQRPVARYLTLWGLVPLHWFYAALLIGGAVLMLWGSPWSPFHPHQATNKAWWARGLLFARQAFSALLFVLLVWIALFT